MTQEELVQLKKEIKGILDAHDKMDFEAFSKYTKDPNKPEKSVISEEDFKEAANNLKSKFGELDSLEFLTVLNKGNSLQSLWKATYLPSKVEICWQIYLLPKNPNGFKIIGLWYN